MHHVYKDQRHMFLSRTFCYSQTWLKRFSTLIEKTPEHQFLKPDFLLHILSL